MDRDVLLKFITLYPKHSEELIVIAVVLLGLDLLHDLVQEGELLLDLLQELAQVPLAPALRDLGSDLGDDRGLDLGDPPALLGDEVGEDGDVELGQPVPDGELGLGEVHDAVLPRGEEVLDGVEAPEVAAVGGDEVAVTVVVVVVIVVFGEDSGEVHGAL